jgi:hypothetical protein
VRQSLLNGMMAEHFGVLVARHQNIATWCRAKG